MSVLTYNAEERDSFFNELSRLIDRYPNLITSVPCNNPDHPHPDPNAPKAVTGIVIIVSTSTTDDFEEIFFEAPIGQSVFHTGGMIEASSRNSL